MEAATMKKIVLFTTTACPHCADARTYLKSFGLDFEEKNVREDMDARQELIEKRILGVPTFFIDEDIIVGFNRRKLENALKN